jgi:DNA repair ATPase RecN
MSETITVTNVGPIERAEIRLDPKGGVTVLRGFNGSGKDHAIEAIARALGGKHSPPCSDGAAKGLIEGLGIRVSLGKVSRRTGECVAVSLTGKFDLSEFVEPREKDPEAADRKRIKALLAIRGVGPDESKFRPMVPESVGPLSIKVTDAPDLVEQARLAKAWLESESRRVADKATKEEGHAAACRESAEGVDLSGESDGDKLQGALEAALREESALEARQDAAERAAEAADEAQTAIERAKAEYTGPSAAEADVKYLQALTLQDEQAAEVAALHAKLQAAGEELGKRGRDAERAEHRLLSQCPRKPSPRPAKP